MGSISTKSISNKKAPSGCKVKNARKGVFSDSKPTLSASVAVSWRSQRLQCRATGDRLGSIPTKSIPNKKTRRVQSKKRPKGRFSDSQPEGLAVEQATGIEPACLAWEASALPLSYACIADSLRCRLSAQIRSANLVSCSYSRNRKAADCAKIPTGFLVAG